MNPFSYDSKFMQILGMFADMVIMNLLYILCCIPIFTIGAAQAGLYTGLRVLVDKDNDEYCYRAFFRGFANGFKRITLVWCIVLVVMLLMVWVLLMIHNYQFTNSSVSVWLSMIALIVLCIYSAVLTSFHSKFECTSWQLAKNTWYTVLGHPIRSIILGALTWLPTAIFLIDPNSFIHLTIIFLTMYYSIALLLCETVMKKHYQHLTSKFFPSPAEETESTEE